MGQIFMSVRAAECERENVIHSSFLSQSEKNRNAIVQDVLWVCLECVREEVKDTEPEWE